uniref:Uncharacterized protein n=1 Tax=Chenopodium quinoa TaxID=63459 RepID=A0A803MW57_CHEQI
MCPLRIILIFLSAALAGFFVLKNLNSSDDVDLNLLPDSPKPKNSSPISYKVMAGICSSFWTVVDMASGRYLWKYFSAASAKSSS